MILRIVKDENAGHFLDLEGKRVISTRIYKRLLNRYTYGIDSVALIYTFLFTF